MYAAVAIGVIALVSCLFYFLMVYHIDHLYFSSQQQRIEEVVDSHPAAGEKKLVLDAKDKPETRKVLSRYLSDSQIEDLFSGKMIHFKHAGEFGTALYSPEDQDKQIVLLLSENTYGKGIRKRFGWLLAGTFLLSTVLIYIIGKRYSVRMVNTIDAAYQSEKDFISNASHEINNPLTAILGECEITLLKERTPGEYEAALKRIATETKRIVQLMKHLLFLSHGDKEILKNATEPIMLANFLMQFLDDRIHFSPDTFAFVVDANPHLLKIAISNLINNALKYSGDKPVEIRLRGSVLEIEDQGIGIPEEELDRIYQPFYRASNTREFKGHGIGLSLTMRILTLYGAEVKIRSAIGTGTTVSVHF